LASVVWLLLRAFLIAEPGLFTWAALFGLAAVALFTARLVRPRSMAAASVVVAVLVPVASALLDLREFTPLLVAVVAVLGALAGAIALAGVVRSAGARADSVTWALTLIGLVANVGLAVFAYRGVVRTNRVFASREAARTVLSAMRDLRAAEEAYRSLNGGFYDRLECVATEKPCIPDYPMTAPIFVDPALAQPLDNGYRRIFHPGPPADPADLDRAKVSPTSLKAYAYVAVPDDPRYHGAPAFCVDSSGRLCVTREGSTPVVVDAQCGPPPDCKDLP
jgi:hypothetical protein